MKKTRIIIGAVLAVGAGLTVAAPASAAIGACPTSHACVYTGYNYGGYHQNISGFTVFSDVNSTQHDDVSSWINANNSQAMAIGEWRNNQQFLAQILPAGWVDSDLRDIKFDNKADFVRQA